MKKPIFFAIITVLIVSFSIIFYYKQVDLPTQGENYKENKNEIIEEKAVPSKDLSICNENGKIMVLMYHDFSETAKDGWTRSFSDFKKDLELLYEKNYYPINLSDYIEGKIDVPYGKTPIILTFDDGKVGQMSFNRVDGELVVKENTAVAIYEKFNKEHPDFPMRGTFYLMEDNFFGATGKQSDRLKYLISKGFEIGNQTLNHYYLPKAKTADEVIKEVGGFAKYIDGLIPGYVINSFSVPGGSMTTKFASSVYSGTYEGFKYENKGIVLLYENRPTFSPTDKELNLKKIPRVRVSGKDKVAKDFEYWINYFDEHPEEKFISDGDVNTFVISKDDVDKVSSDKFNIVFKQ